MPAEDTGSGRFAEASLDGSAPRPYHAPNMSIVLVPSPSFLQLKT